MNYDVFISYSRKDLQEVKAFKEMLEQRVPGIKIWFDMEGIKSRDEFDDVIIKAIDNSKQMIFFLSPNSNNSEYAKDEVMYAKNTGKPITPVLLRKSKLEGWFLFKFGRINCINSTKPEEVAILVRDLGGQAFQPVRTDRNVCPPYTPQTPTSRNYVTPHTPKTVTTRPKRTSNFKWPGFQPWLKGFGISGGICLSAMIFMLFSEGFDWLIVEIFLYMWLGLGFIVSLGWWISDLIKTNR